MSRFWYLTLLLGISLTLSTAAPVNSTTALISRGIPCAFPETKDPALAPASVKLRPADGGDMETIQIRYLGRGASGCAYDVQGGYKNPVTKENEEAVYKTKRLDRVYPPLKSNEICALRANKLLWGLFLDDNGWRSAIVKKEPGKLVFDTPRWKEQFPYNYLISNPKPGTVVYKACKEFISSLHEKITIAIQRFGEWDPHDVNWENFLWSDDLEHVTVIDLGEARHIPGDQREYWEQMVPVYFSALERASELPVEDNEDGYQGICYSKKRESGVAWQNPFIRDGVLES